MIKRYHIMIIEWRNDMTANKVLNILTLFTMDNRSMTVEEISKELGIPASSVYRHIRVLKEYGYLIEDNYGNYKLGYKFLELANIVRADISLTSIAKSYMDELTTRFRETTILNVISGLNAVCLTTSVIDNAAIKVSSAEGKVMPLFGGASAKALLAYQDDKVIDKIFDNNLVNKITEKTITDKNKLNEDKQKFVSQTDNAQGEYSNKFTDNQMTEKYMNMLQSYKEFDKKWLLSLKKIDRKITFKSWLKNNKLLRS